MQRYVASKFVKRVANGEYGTGTVDYTIAQSTFRNSEHRNIGLCCNDTT